MNKAALAQERSAHAQERAKVARLQDENDKLRDAYARLRQETEPLRRRIFVAKAERIGTAQLEIEFANKLADLNALKGSLPEGHESLFEGQHGKVLTSPADGADGKNGSGGGKRNFWACSHFTRTPTGRYAARRRSPPRDTCRARS